MSGVTKDHINREFHKNHVNGLTVGYDQSLPLSQALAAKQAFDTLPGIAGDGNARCDRALAGKIDYHVIYYRIWFWKAEYRG